MYNSPSKSVQTDTPSNPCPCWNWNVAELTRPDELLEAEACLRQCKCFESHLRRLRKRKRRSVALRWRRLFIVTFVIFLIVWFCWWLIKPPPPPPELSLWNALYSLFFEDFWKSLDSPLQ